MGRKVFVVGVGMTKFEKPGSTGKDYPDFAKEAVGRVAGRAAIAVCSCPPGSRSCPGRSVFAPSARVEPVHSS